VLLLGSCFTSIPASADPGMDNCSACSSMKSVHKKNNKASIYVCPMHPEVTSKKPGRCPKCGMNLEKK
jgi:hypothetical protein